MKPLWRSLIGILLVGGITSPAFAQLYQTRQTFRQAEYHEAETMVWLTVIPGGSSRPGAWVTGPLAQTLVVPVETIELLGVEAMTGAVSSDLELEEGQADEPIEARPLERAGEEERFPEEGAQF